MLRVSGEGLIDKKSTGIVRGFHFTNCAGRSCRAKRSTCKSHCSLLHPKHADQLLSSCKLVKLHWFCRDRAWIVALYYSLRKSGAIALQLSGGAKIFSDLKLDSPLIYLWYWNQTPLLRNRNPYLLLTFNEFHSLSTGEDLYHSQSLD